MMPFGLSEGTIHRINGVFSKFPAVTGAILYGSRAKGNFREGSDIDLTLLGNEVTHDILGAIHHDLDDLLLPDTIDLSIKNKLSHAALLDHIHRVGVVFYEKPLGNGGP
jgi:predicted nucleotidyltransferase